MMISVTKYQSRYKKIYDIDNKIGLSDWFYRMRYENRKDC